MTEDEKVFECEKAKTMLGTDLLCCQHCHASPARVTGIDYNVDGLPAVVCCNVMTQIDDEQRYLSRG